MDRDMLAQYLGFELPRQLHRERRLLLFALLGFLLSLLGAFLLVQLQPESIYFFYGRYELSELTRIYESELIGFEPYEMADIWQNTLFYFLNNGLVGLQLFVAGSLLGLGTLMLLVYSATSLGMLMGHIYLNGYGAALWPVIIGHGALEVVATVLSAAAGFRLGLWLLQCLRCKCFIQARASLKHLLGLMLPAMLLYAAAALVEAGWSHNPAIAVWARYGFGGLLWAGMGAYLYFAICRGGAISGRGTAVD